MTRHVKEMHDGEASSEGEKQCVCTVAGCGKTFKYPSKLRKHEDSHSKFDIAMYCLLLCIAASADQEVPCRH